MAGQVRTMGVSMSSRLGPGSGGVGGRGQSIQAQARPMGPTVKAGKRWDGATVLRHPERVTGINQGHGAAKKNQGGTVAQPGQNRMGNGKDAFTKDCAMVERG
jgi:hypothetical protein